jgi:hypothetical protein
VAVDFTPNSDILNPSYKIGEMICRQQEKSPAKERIGAIDVGSLSDLMMIRIPFRRVQNVITLNLPKSDKKQKTAAIA